MNSDKYYIKLKIIENSLKYIDPDVSSIINKCLDNKELNLNDLLTILSCNEPELTILRILADYLRWVDVNDYVTFVVNRNINFTNGCIIGCLFCAFSKPINHPDVYVLPIEVIIGKVIEARKLGATEVCIQGGINPKINPEYYFEIIEKIKKYIPEIHIHAYSPQEIYYLAHRLEMKYVDVLKWLKDVGLNSIPGTAAEILDNDIRRILSPNRLSVQDWIEIIKTAHSLGIPTTATIMYGHIEDNIHRAKHLEIIKNIQKETKGFTEFVLLPFVHFNTKLYRIGLAKPSSTILEDIKLTIASRLYLRPYIKNIQVSWVKLGKKIVQILLNCGANDIGGTLMEEHISSSAGSKFGTYMTVKEMIQMIQEINRIPAQRTTTYEIIKVFS